MFGIRRRDFITLLGGAAAVWPLAARAQQPERMRRIGVLMNLAADDPEGQARVAAFLQGLQEAGWAVGRNAQVDIRWGMAQALGREMIVVGGRSDFDFEIAFDTLVQRGAGALVVGNSPWAIERRHKILTLAARHKVPAMYPFSAFVFDGGLMSYGVGRGIFRQVASHYVGQILKGAKPKDLPVQQPSNFELVINLKTARSLGIDVPDKLLALADEVIE